MVLNICEGNNRQMGVVLLNNLHPNIFKTEQVHLCSLNSMHNDCHCPVCQGR